ncbi:hypothetical protein FGO68_gene5819 [Halteria grandinella]|uniref:Uncharacterized protein n=1 Tax=Halteria grandinella TaxID=5974 RepID=A0A8J8T177_HALGN|nr:hypothetical protein FGO68_gene5819 [Halteria grandinella]
MGGWDRYADEPTQVLGCYTGQRLCSEQDVGYSVNFGQKLESMSLINTLLISNATLFLEPYLPSSKILTTSIDESHQVVASIKQIFYDKLNVELKQSPKGNLYLSQSCTDLDIFYQPITLQFEGNKSISLNLQNMFIQDGANCNLQLLIVAAAPSIQVHLNSKAFIEIGVTFDLEKDTVSFSGGFELGGIIIVIKRRQGLKKDLITYQSI